MPEGDPSSIVGSIDQPTKTRDLVDILIVALIAAQVIRFIAAVVAGVVHGTFTVPGETLRASFSLQSAPLRTR